MILRKPRSLMKPTKNEMEHAVGPSRSQHIAPVWRYFLSLTNHKRKRVCIFLHHETVIDGNNGSRPFLSPLFTTVQCDVVHQVHDFRHKQHTNLSRQLVQNRHVLVSLDSLDPWGFTLALGTSASNGSSTSPLPISTSSLGISIGSVSSPVGARSCSEFSLDLRARCSALLVSRLLNIVHDTVFLLTSFLCSIRN